MERGEVRHLQRFMAGTPPTPSPVPAATQGHDAFTDPLFDALLQATPTTPQDLLPAAVEQVPKDEPLDVDELDLGMTDEQIEQMCEHMRRGTPRLAACRLAGIPPKQLATWLKDDLDAPSKHPLVQTRRNRLRRYKAAILEAESWLESELSGKIIQAALDPERPDLDAAQWVLERRYRQNWGKQSSVTHKGRVQHEHTHKGAPPMRLSDLSDQDVKQLEEMMLRASRALPSPQDVIEGEFSVAGSSVAPAGLPRPGELV